jgi:hypothetical protein
MPRGSPISFLKNSAMGIPVMRRTSSSMIVPIVSP